MKKNKIILSIAILGAATGISLYLFLAPPSLNDASKSLVQIEPTKQSANPNLNFANQLSSNLTNQFADKSLEKLIAENQPLVDNNTKDLSKAKLVPNSVDVEQIVSSIIDSEAGSEKIDPKEISVNNNDSRAIELFYVLFVNELVKTKLNEISSLDPAAAQSITSYFSEVATRFDETAEMLKGINVPLLFKETHIQLVEFFLKQRNIYRALSVAETDPFNFYVAAYKIIPLEAEKELQKIMAQVVEKLKNEKNI